MQPTTFRSKFMQSNNETVGIFTECDAVGDNSADIMIIGECPGAEDVRTRETFSGQSGRELETMLSAVGISRSSTYQTYAAKARPPRGYVGNFFVNQKKYIPSEYLLQSRALLKEEIRHVKPKLIIALGMLPLWMLTGEPSIMKWRGSQLTYDLEDGTTCWLLPTYSPTTIFRQWTLRNIAVQDLRRAARYQQWEYPNYDFTLRPTFAQCTEFLSELEERARVHGVLVSGDIETRGGHIACFGIGVSKTRAICIPFMDIKKPDGHYFLPEEEVAIVQQLVRIFRNGNLHWIFQNGTYDFQYFARYWGTMPNLATDTMLEHHVAWAGDLPKGLDFLSSMYCTFHRYWKDDGKLWDPRYTPEEQLWEYNCKDCVVTWEVGTVLAEQTKALGLEAQVHFQTIRQFRAVLRMMLRGVRCDTARKKALSSELATAYEQMRARLEYICGQSLNVKSPKQMAAFFYDFLGMPVQRDRKTQRVTTNAKALQTIAKKAPYLQPIVELIETMRSIGVFKSTFVDMALDEDNRIRCSYNIAGTETFRFSSSENAFGTGTNLQNIPDGKKNKGRGLPNVKLIFLPDTGKILGEIDLKQADAQVVAWESNDEKLKFIFRNGIDLHLANASDIYNLGIRLEDIADPEGIEWHTKKYGRERQAAKGGVHAVNYGVEAYTLSGALGISVADAQVFINKWFSEHPGIRDWQTRIALQLQTTREVRNAFGFRRYYFDRVEHLLPEALAWIPQSTVALIVDHAIVEINENLPEIEPLLQVHDSLVVQFDKDKMHETLPKLEKAVHITVPYPDPLIIPAGIEVSKKSWGDKKKIDWNFRGEVTW